MTREVRVVPAGDPGELMAALRGALAGDGPAIMPVANERDEDGIGPVPRQVALVIETSGSTDAPKRVMLATDALLASAAGSSAALGGPGQWLLALPAHYVAGVQVLVRSIVAGTTPVVMPSGHFDPRVFADCAEQLTEPLRYTSLVPVQLARLVDAAESDARLRRILRRFTAILVGGQAVHPELVERAEALDVRLVRTYGSSETAGGCVYNGMPIGACEVRVSPDDGGQLEIAGDMLALGYLGDDERTAERFLDVRGVRWYRTGDLGDVSADGRVQVFGRADNVVISGGEKVSLDAVEGVVRSLPGMAEAVAVGADDATWGQVPVVVVPASDAVPALADVREAVASALGAPARPARVITVQHLPMLASGKPDRQALRGL